MMVSNNAWAATPAQVSVTLPDSPLLPGVPFSISGQISGADSDLKTLNLSVSSCKISTTTNLGSGTFEGMVLCPTTIHSSVLRVKALTANGTNISSSQSLTLSATVPESRVRISRGADPCGVSRKITVAVDTEQGPVAGLPVLLRITPPAGNTNTPDAVLITTGDDGTALATVTVRNGWSLQAITQKSGPWTPRESTSMMLTPDHCSTVVTTTTTAIPERVAYGSTYAIGGKVLAVRDDGASVSLYRSAVTVTQLITTARGDAAVTKATTTSDKNGNWATSIRLTSSGPLRVTAETTSKIVTPQVDDQGMGTVNVQNYLADITAALSYKTSVLTSGSTATLAGRVRATDPVTHQDASPKVVANLVLDIALTPDSRKDTSYPLTTTTVRTDSTGAFSVPVAIARTGVVTVNLSADTKGVTAPTEEVPIAVSAVPTLRLPVTDALTGQDLALSMRLRPSIRDAKVDVQYRASGTNEAWKTLAANTPITTRSITGPDKAGIYELRTSYSGGVDALAGQSTSTNITIKVPTGILATPTSFGCTSTRGAAAICEWSAPQGVSVTGYRIMRGTTLISSCPSSPCTLPLTATPLGSSATLTVRSVLAGGSVSSPSAAATVTRLAAPTNVRVSAHTPTSLTITWDKVTAADGYSVSVDGSEPALMDNASLSYTVDKLNPGSTHTFSVQAITDNQDSSTVSNLDATADAVVRGGAPVITGCDTLPLSSSDTTASLDCRWVAVPGTTTAYRVYVDGIATAVTASVPFPTNVDGTVPNTRATIKGLTPDRRYVITVVAIGPLRESEYSNAYSAHTAPIPVDPLSLAPVVMSATSAGSDSVTISWTSQVGADHYTMTVDGQAEKTINSTSTTVDKLTRPTWVSIKAVALPGFKDSAPTRLKVAPGQGAVPGSMTCEGKTGTYTPACESPNGQWGTVALSWTAVPGANSYQILRDGTPVTSTITPDANWPAAENGTVRSTWAKVSGLTPTGTSSTFTVVPIMGTSTGFSAGLGASTSTTGGVVTGPASAGLDIWISAPDKALDIPKPYVLSQTDTDITLTWPDVTAATSYTITGPGLLSAITVNSHTVTLPLTAPTLVSVVARGGRGTLPSATASINIAPGAASTVVQNPLNCSSTVVGQLNCSWAAIPGATSYRLLNGTTSLNCTGLLAGWSIINGSPDVARNGTSGSTACTAAVSAGSIASISLVAVNADASVRNFVPIQLRIASTLPTPLPRASASTSTSITLTWKAIEGASGYQVKVQNRSAVTVADVQYTISDVGSSPLNVMITALPGTGYARSETSTISVATPSDTPAIVCSRGSTNGTLSCAWNAVVGAVTYRLSYNGVPVSTVVPVPSSNWPPAGSGVVSGTSANITNLPFNTQAAMTVTAVGPDGDLTTSQPYSLTVPGPTVALAAPQPMLAGADGGRVTLSWAAVPSATSYSISADSSPATQVTGTSATVLLTHGQHIVTVTAQGGLGTTSASASLRVTNDILSPPQDFVCSSNANGVVTCSWSAALGAVSYRLANNGVSISSGMSVSNRPWYALGAVVTGTDVTITGIAPSSMANLTLVAVTSGGVTSSPSVTAPVRVLPVPALPAPIPRHTGGTVADGKGTVQISWNAIPNAMQYVATICDTANPTTRKSFDVASTQTTFDSLVPGHTYDVSVVAQGDGGLWANSPAATITVNPSALTL